MSPSTEKRTASAVADAVGLGDVVGAAVDDDEAVVDGEVGAVATFPASGPVQAARSTARAARTGAAGRRRVMTAV